MQEKYFTYVLFSEAYDQIYIGFSTVDIPVMLTPSPVILTPHQDDGSKNELD